MTPVVSLASVSDARVARVLDALGVVFERRPLPQAGPTAPEALILSEDEFAALVDPREGLSRYRHVLVYPFRGTPDGLRALGRWAQGRAEVLTPSPGAASVYRVGRDFAAAGPFAGLEVAPVDRRADLQLVVASSAATVESIIAAGEGALFVRIASGSTELFVASTAAVFDVEAEVVRNLDVRECFSALVPLLFFLRHVQAEFWRTSHPAANVIIDDLNLRPQYGFVDTRMLARSVEQLTCAVSIAFIPWNCSRASGEIADLFRSRWPRLSLCVHGCDHVGAEFSTPSVSSALSMIAMSLARMRSLETRTGVPYDRVMVFPQGRFSGSAMEALRRSSFLAAVNTELVDHESGRGVAAAELLKPAVTSYAGFPLFLRRKIDQPIANFALDLLLGKPCLVVTHHDDFQRGMEPFASFVTSLSALDPALEWTNLGAIVSRTYSTRYSASSTVDVRLLSRDTLIEPHAAGTRLRVSKAEPLARRDFEIAVAGTPIKVERRDSDLVFQHVITAPGQTSIEVKTADPEPVLQGAPPLRYRTRVAARRYLSEIRDNYVAKSPLATAAVRRLRGMAAERRHG